MVNYAAANAFFDDKECIAAGPGGDVYVTWTLFKFNRGQGGYIYSKIVEAGSHDYGASWSSPIAVSDSTHPFDQGPSPGVGPHGTVYVAHEENTASDVHKHQRGSAAA